MPVAPVFTLRASPTTGTQLSAIAKSGLPVSAKTQLYREFWGKFLQRRPTLAAVGRRRPVTQTEACM